MKKPTKPKPMVPQRGWSIAWRDGIPICDPGGALVWTSEKQAIKQCLYTLPGGRGVELIPTVFHVVRVEVREIRRKVRRKGAKRAR